MELKRLVPKLISARNFSASYGFAPLWPRAYMGVSLEKKGRDLLSKRINRGTASRERKILQRKARFNFPNLSNQINNTTKQQFIYTYKKYN